MTDLDTDVLFLTETKLQGGKRCPAAIAEVLHDLILHVPSCKPRPAVHARQPFTEDGPARGRQGVILLCTGMCWAVSNLLSLKPLMTDLTECLVNVWIRKPVWHSSQPRMRVLSLR